MSSLVDYETKRNIVSPYIVINHLENSGECLAMNTSTFGEEGQRNLIHNFELQKLFLVKEFWKDCYRVCAIVGRPTDELRARVGTRCIFDRYIHDDSNGSIYDAIAITPLGYLPKKFVRKHYPRVFRYFKRHCKKKSKLELSASRSG